MTALRDLSDEDLYALRDRGARARPISEWSDEELANAAGRRTPTQSVSALLSGAADGATFGWGDEALGAIRGVGSAISGGDFGDAYEQSVSESRGRQADARETSPFLFGAGQFGGSMLPFLIPGLGAAGAASRGASAASSALNFLTNPMGGLARRTLGGAVTGGAFGALSGAGHDDGEGDMGGAALGGAASGALFGGLVAPSFAALGAAGRIFRSGDRGPPGMMSNIVGAHGEGRLPGGFGTVPERVSDEAADDFIRVMGRSGHTTDSLNNYISDALTDPSRGRTFVDAFGNAGINRMKFLGKVPGETSGNAEMVFRDRNRGALQRLENDIAGPVGPRGPRQNPSAYDAEREVERLRRTIGAQAYRDIFTRGRVGGDINQAAFNERLAPLLSHPRFQPVLREASELAEFEDLLARQRGEDPLPPLDLFRDESGVFRFAGMPSARTLHAIKMALDAQTASVVKQAARGESGIAASTAPILTQLRREVLNALDDGTERSIIPGYSAARSQYAGLHEAEEAIERGRSIFARNGSPQELADYVSSLTPFQQRFFRAGVNDEMLRILRSKDIEGRRNLGDALLSTQKLSALRAAIPDANEFDLIRRGLSTESLLQRNAQAASPRSGSDTGVVIAEGMDDFANNLPRGPLDAVWGVAREALNDIMGALAEGRRNEAGRLLLQSLDDPATAPQVRDFLAQIARRLETRGRDARNVLFGPLGGAAQTGTLEGGNQFVSGMFGA